MQNKTIMRIYGSCQFAEGLLARKDSLKSVELMDKYVDMKTANIKEVVVRDSGDIVPTDAILFTKDFMVNIQNTEGLKEMMDAVRFFNKKGLAVSVILETIDLSQWVVFEGQQLMLIDVLGNEGVVNIIGYKNNKSVLEPKTLAILDELAGKHALKSIKQVKEFYGLSDNRNVKDTFENMKTSSESNSNKDKKSPVKKYNFNELLKGKLDNVDKTNDVLPNKKEEPVEEPVKELTEELTEDEDNVDDLISSLSEDLGISDNTPVSNVDIDIDIALNTVEEGLKAEDASKPEPKPEPVKEVKYVQKYTPLHVITDDDKGSVIRLLGASKKRCHTGIKKLSDEDKEKLSDLIEHFNSVKDLKLQDIEELRWLTEDVIFIAQSIEDAVEAAQKLVIPKPETKPEPKQEVKSEVKPEVKKGKKQRKVVNLSNVTQIKEDSNAEEMPNTEVTVSLESGTDNQIEANDTQETLINPDGRVPIGMSPDLSMDIGSAINFDLFSLSEVEDKSNELTFHIFDVDNFSKEIPVANNILNIVSGQARTTRPDEVLIINLSASEDSKVSLKTIDAVFFAAKDEDDVKSLISQAIIKDEYRPNLLIMQNYVNVKSELVGGILPYVPANYKEVHVIVNFDNFQEAIKEFQGTGIGNTKLYINSNFNVNEEVMKKFSKVIKNGKTVSLNEDKMFRNSDK